MLRDRFSADLKEALKAKDAHRVSTLRLIMAAVKDRDIAARVDESSAGVPDSEILGLLAKMIKQRQDSATTYEEGGRLDLADQERGEIKIIREYLPRQMSEDEVRTAISTAISDTGAASIRDMGRVMAELKARHTGKMDFTRACAAVKEAFS